VNHLAGALLIRRLLPRLRKSAPARIVQVASLGQAPFEHPATFMDTDMVREGGITPRSSVDEGLRATLRLLVAPELDGMSGRFFDGIRETEPNPAADDPQARALCPRADRGAARR